MKAIIYAGIGLFSIASVYGVADYYGSKKNGSLDNLYREDLVTPVQEIIPSDEESITGRDNPNSTVAIKTAVVKESSKLNRKAKPAKRTIRVEDYSRGRIEPPPAVTEAVFIAAEPKEGPVPEVVPVKATETVPEKTLAEFMKVEEEPVRKLSMEMFSRGRIIKKPVKLKKQTPEVIVKNQ